MCLCVRGGTSSYSSSSSAPSSASARSPSCRYYVVLPFYTCNQTEVFISAAAPSACAVFADINGWNAFSIGNGACSEDTDTACTAGDVRCFMYGTPSNRRQALFVDALV